MSPFLQAAEAGAVQPAETPRQRLFQAVLFLRNFRLAGRVPVAARLFPAAVRRFRVVVRAPDRVPDRAPDRASYRASHCVQGWKDCRYVHPLKRESGPKLPMQAAGSTVQHCAYHIAERRVAPVKCLLVIQKVQPGKCALLLPELFSAYLRNDTAELARRCSEGVPVSGTAFRRRQQVFYIQAGMPRQRRWHEKTCYC